MTKRGKRRLITSIIEKKKWGWKVIFSRKYFLTDDEINAVISGVVRDYCKERNEKTPEIEKDKERDKNGKKHLIVWLTKKIW